VAWYGGGKTSWATIAAALGAGKPRRRQAGGGSHSLRDAARLLLGQCYWVMYTNGKSERGKEGTLHGVTVSQGGQMEGWKEEGRIYTRMAKDCVAPGMLPASLAHGPLCMARARRVTGVLHGV